MTIDEAIEELNTLKSEASGHPEKANCIQLGIAALGWIKGWRRVNSALSNTKLPGETEK